MRGDTKNNCKQLPMELQSRDQGGKGKTMPKARDGENSHLSSSQSTFQWMYIPFYIPLSHQHWKAQLLPLHIPKALILLPALRFLRISISFNRLFCLCGTLLPPNELLHEFRIHQRYFHCLYLACCKNPNIWHFCIMVSQSMYVSDLHLPFEPKKKSPTLSAALVWELEVDIVQEHNFRITLKRKNKLENIVGIY